MFHILCDVLLQGHKRGNTMVVTRPNLLFEVSNMTIYGFGRQKYDITAIQPKLIQLQMKNGEK